MSRPLLGCTFWAKTSHPAVPSPESKVRNSGSAASASLFEWYLLLVIVLDFPKIHIGFSDFSRVFSWFPAIFQGSNLLSGTFYRKFRTTLEFFPWLKAEYLLRSAYVLYLYLLIFLFLFPLLYLIMVPHLNLIKSFQFSCYILIFPLQFNKPEPIFCARNYLYFINTSSILVNSYFNVSFAF